MTHTVSGNGGQGQGGKAFSRHSNNTHVPRHSSCSVLFCGVRLFGAVCFDDDDDDDGDGVWSVA